ncbi:MAG: hypothetical protein AAB373_00100 [Patescibacteria group bacterium]
MENKKSWLYGVAAVVAVAAIAAGISMKGSYVQGKLSLSTPSVIVSVDPISPEGKTMLAGGPFETVTILKFTAGPQADVEIKDLTLTKKGVIPDAAIGNISAEFVGSNSQGTGANGMQNGKAKLTFNPLFVPFVIPAGTSKSLAISVAINPSLVGGQFSLGILEKDSSTAEYVNHITFENPDTVVQFSNKDAFGNVFAVVQPADIKIDLSFKDFAIKLKNKEKSLYFTVYLKNKNAGKQLIDIQMLMDGKVFYSGKIKANTVFISNDFMKKNLKMYPFGTGQGACDGTVCTAENMFHSFSVKLDPDNKIKETNECNEANFGFTLETAKNNSPIMNGGGGCDYVTQL